MKKIIILLALLGAVFFQSKANEEEYDGIKVNMVHSSKYVNDWKTENPGTKYQRRILVSRESYLVGFESALRDTSILVRVAVDTQMRGETKQWVRVRFNKKGYGTGSVVLRPGNNNWRLISLSDEEKAERNKLEAEYQAKHPTKAQKEKEKERKKLEKQKTKERKEAEKRADKVSK